MKTSPLALNLFPAGVIEPVTQKVIAKYQSLNGFPATGQINVAMLKSLNIM
jgi:hypothetical protein